MSWNKSFMTISERNAALKMLRDAGVKPPKMGYCVRFRGGELCHHPASKHHKGDTGYQAINFPTPPGQLDGLGGSAYMRVPGKAGRGLSGLSAAQVINDRERELWVQNDQGLYNWWKSSRQPMRAFIRENRAELTELINKALQPREKTWRDY